MDLLRKPPAPPLAGSSGAVVVDCTKKESTPRKGHARVNTPVAKGQATGAKTDLQTRIAWAEKVKAAPRGKLEAVYKEAKKETGKS